jgi:hypothetical protein
MPACRRSEGRAAPGPALALACRTAQLTAAPHSLVKDEAHWQAEFAREQSPLLLPCTFADGTVAGINFYCLGMMAAKGTLTDRDDWPVYQVGH